METKFIQTSDLANVITLIDGAAKQGFFAGDQLAVIGGMRERFHAELKEQAPTEDNVAHIENEEPRVEVSSEPG